MVSISKLVATGLLPICNLKHAAHVPGQVSYGHMPTESILLRQLLLRATEQGRRLFRVNTGTGWVGQAIRISRAGTIQVQFGDVLVRQARPLRAGLTDGGSDLIGWSPHVVTAADIGKTLAIFTAVEAKTPHTRMTRAQRAFLDAVRTTGGIAILAHEAADLPQSVDARAPQADN